MHEVSNKINTHITTIPTPYDMGDNMVLYSVYVNLGKTNSNSNKLVAWKL